MMIFEQRVEIGGRDRRQIARHDQQCLRTVFLQLPCRMVQVGRQPGAGLFRNKFTAMFRGECLYLSGSSPRHTTWPMPVQATQQ